MTTKQKPRFERRYHDALQRVLTPQGGRARAERTAFALGNEAISSGMNAMALVKVHNESLVAIVALDRDRADGQVMSCVEAAAFLSAALKPIVRETTQRLRRIKGQLNDNGARLIATRRQMRTEAALHWTCRQQLVQGTRHYDQLLDQSRRMQDQSRRLAHQILFAQEEERKEISRELHDEVAQILAGINVKLASLNEASAIDGRSLRRRIAQTQRLVEKSVRVVHRYARELRPALLDDLGLVPALRSFIKDLPGRNGLIVKFNAFADVEALGNKQRTVLYRVAQEALTNVARHAHARSASIRIAQKNDVVCLEVRDNGRAFPAERILSSNTYARLGLLGMRERVEMIGGVFSIRSIRGSGTTVRAEIPFGRRHKGRR